MSADSMWPNYPEGAIVKIEELTRPIQRGDAIAFTRAEKDVIWVKRVVAIGGDTVKMSGAVPVINGVPLKRERLPDRVHAYTGKAERVVLCFNERVDDNSYQVCELAGLHNKWDTTEMQRVPNGTYFVLGDNRDNSRDSRDSMMGFIEEMYVIGIVSEQEAG